MVAEPQGSRHAATVSLVAEALRVAFGHGWYVMTQLPVALDAESEPEPDVAVVPGTAREYWDAHPSRPVLVVEVADSSVTLDREYKSSLYARAGVPDYWIVNIIESILEVYQRPVPAPGTPYGWSYAEVQRLGRDATLSPAAAPTSRIVVADLLR
jgi:Uma2 family endonuclease